MGKPNNFVTPAMLQALREKILSEIRDEEHPANSRWIQFYGEAPPAERFGGAWTVDGDYTGRTLVGSGEGFALGATGGSADAVTVKHVHHTYMDRQGNIQDSRFPIGTYSPAAYSDLPYSLRNSTESAPWGGKTDEVGEDGTGKNMPPYKIVTVWKRIA